MRLHNYFLTAAFTLALIVLLTLSASAMPAGSQSWTEEPWAGGTPQPLETRVSNLSDPIAFNLSGREPDAVLLGKTPINYRDYTCSPSSPPVSSELWMQKDAVWSRYEQLSAGEDVDLIAYTPRDGSVDIYLISYANSTINHWNFDFPAGYHRLKLRPEESGRLFLLLAQGSEPGNALILDVLARPEKQSILPLDVSSILMGDSLVTIKSLRTRGYDVYVDGVFFSSDLSDGALDGVARFTIGGEKTHTITISERDGQGGIINKNEHTKSFKRETAYTLLIE